MPIGYPTNPQTLTEHVKRARMDKELTQKQVAEALNLTTDTIENWEANRNQVKLMHIPAVTKFLGYCLVEYHKEGGWKQTLLNYRKQRGWSSLKMAKFFKIDEGSLKKIERGEKLMKKIEKRI